MNCKKCGAILSSEDLFCKQCGQAINNENSQVNSMPNMSYQNVEKNYNTQANQYNQQYGQYNNYNAEHSGNSSIGKVILIIVLIIIFWIVGFFLGKLMFGEKDVKNDIKQESSIPTLNSSNSDNKETNNSNIVSSTSTSYIVTDSNSKITFEVYNSLKEDAQYSDNNSKCLEKVNKNDNNEDLFIWIREDYGTINEYMQDIENQANNKKSSLDYSNVQLSEVKTTTVNGNKFYYRLLDYNMGETKFKKAFFVYEIEDDSLYTIEVEQYDVLSNEELNGLLSINVSK